MHAGPPWLDQRWPWALRETLVGTDVVGWPLIGAQRGDDISHASPDGEVRREGNSSRFGKAQ